MAPTMYLFVCLAVFVAGYCLTLGYTSVFYHRGFTHGSLTLQPWLRRFVAATGTWVTALDAKAWSCMHRRHHRFADTPQDPHSPVHVGFFGVMGAQVRSYENTVAGLVSGDARYTDEVVDLDFPVHWLNRRGLWYAPTVLHLGIGLGLGLGLGLWLLGAAYAAGMLSHPFQGFVVNAFGHRFGGRNFETPDQSRNNLLVAALVFGEGLQNNHHRFPASARFSYRRREIDLGYVWCLGLEKLRCLSIHRELLMPRRAAGGLA